MTWKEEGEDRWTILQSFINKFTIKEYLNKSTDYHPVFFKTSFVKRKNEYPLDKLVDFIQNITNDDYKNLFLDFDLEGSVEIRRTSVSIRKYGEIKKTYLSNIEEIVSEEILKSKRKTTKSIRPGVRITPPRLSTLNLFGIKDTLNYPLYFSIYNGIATLIPQRDVKKTDIKLGVIDNEGDISDGYVNIKAGINSITFTHDTIILPPDILRGYKKPLLGKKFKKIKKSKRKMYVKKVKKSPKKKVKKIKSPKRKSLKKKK